MTKMYRMCLGRLRRSRLPVLILSLLRGLASRLEAWLERPASSGALPVATTDSPTAELAWRVDAAPGGPAATTAPVSAYAATPALAPPLPPEPPPPAVTLPPPARRPGEPPPIPRLVSTPRPTPASLRATAARPRRGLPPGLPRRIAR